MRKIYCFVWVLLAVVDASSQLTLNGAVKVTGNDNGFLVLNNLGIVNNTAAADLGGIVQMSGNTASTIGGTVQPGFSHLVVSKLSGAGLTLMQSISVKGSVQFESGLLDLNNHDLHLTGSASLFGEKESSRVVGPLGGVIDLDVHLFAGELNAGNIGAVIKTSKDMGIIKIIRGHRVQSGTGLATAISRFYDFQIPNNSGLAVDFSFKYFNAELNGIDEKLLTMSGSANGGVSWSGVSVASRDTVANVVVAKGFSTLPRLTLTGPLAALPVRDLKFAARRNSGQLVSLTWTTSMEVNNKGFYVERKLAGENAFVSLGFVLAHASRVYGYSDVNAFAGVSQYRLRQVDLDEQVMYSPVVSVRGVSGEVVMTVYPNPCAGTAVVSLPAASGVVRVFDAAGKLVRNVAVASSNVVVSGLFPGMYVLKYENAGVALTERLLVQ